MKWCPSRKQWHDLASCVMLLMVAEDGFEPPTRVLDDLAMERLDDMRTSLETDATDPPGLALVRAPVGLLSQQTG